MKIYLYDDEFIKSRIKNDDEKTDFELTLDKELYWFRAKSYSSIYWITVELSEFLDGLKLGRIRNYSSYPTWTEIGSNLENEYQRKLKLNKFLNAV